MSDIPELEDRLPAFKKEEFHCSHCGVYAHQEWEELVINYPPNEFNYDYVALSTYSPYVSLCQHCNKHSLWVNEKKILPDTSDAPQPNKDMSDEIKKIYNEAARVLSKSPRASAALLRLALEKLCKEQGEDNKSLQENIDFLVEKKNYHPE